MVVVVVVSPSVASAAAVLGARELCCAWCGTVAAVFIVARLLPPAFFSCDCSLGCERLHRFLASKQSAAEEQSLRWNDLTVARCTELSHCAHFRKVKFFGAAVVIQVFLL